MHTKEKRAPCATPDIATQADPFWFWLVAFLVCQSHPC